MTLPITIHLTAVPGSGQEPHTAPSNRVDFDEHGVTIREGDASLLAGAKFYPWHRVDRIEYGRSEPEPTPLPSEREPVG